MSEFNSMSSSTSRQGETQLHQDVFEEPCHPCFQYSQNPNLSPCLATLKGSSSYVSGLVFDSDSLYVASSDGHIRLWPLDMDMQRAEQSTSTSTVAVTNSPIKSIIATSDGGVVSSHQDGKIRVWHSGRRRNGGSSHSDDHLALRLRAILPTAADCLRTFLFPSNYVEVQQRHRSRRRTWVHHVDAVTALALSPDGAEMYSVSWDRSLKAWRLLPGLRCVESVAAAHDDAINAVAVSADGHVYTGSADRTIRAWRRQPVPGRGGKKLALVATMERHKAAVNALALGADGRVLYSGACDKTVIVWERAEESMTATATLKGHTGAVLCLAAAGQVVCSGPNVSVTQGRRIPPYESRFPADTSNYESGSFASRCSVRMIKEVVGKFDQEKRELVKAIGFHGILYFPDIKQFNRKYSLWLMSSVDVPSSTINIGDQISLKFGKADVGHVIGIPSCGKRILDSRFSYREAKERALSDYLPAEFREVRSIKIIQEVLDREYEYPMSKSEVDRFKIAFVVFVASNLLSPSAKYDYACVDYWNGIQDPDSIGSYDWAEYVIVRLLEAVSKLKQDLSSNIRFPNLTGCSIFLQVLYLDSLKLDGLAMPHNTFPRIRDFSYEKIRSMVAADRNYMRYTMGDRGIPLTTLREPSECIYLWAIDIRFGTEYSRSGSMLAIWDCAVAMVHLLNIPLEAAGPLYVAAADFHDQINAGLDVNGMQAIKFMTALVSIMIPFSRGFRYQSSYGVDSDNSGNSSIESAVTNGIRMLSCPIRNKRMKLSPCPLTDGPRISDVPEVNGNDISVNPLVSSSGPQSNMSLGEVAIGDDVQRSLRSVIASLDGVPHALNVDMRVATAMSKFYACLRTLNPARSFDLNALSPEATNSSGSSNVSVSSGFDGLPSPWELGYSWSVSDANSISLSDKLKDVAGDDRIVIIHKFPKHIQVSGRALRSQLLGKSEFELDMLDMTIRLLRQEDDELYAAYGSFRWRYLFESDFMGFVMSGSFDLLDSKLHNNIGLGNKIYDFSKTKLVFFPALLQCRWVCFVWHLENNLISVFDPSHGHCIPGFTVEAIERACYLLKLALQNLCRTVFIGVSHDVVAADLRIVTLVDDRLQRSNRTGLLLTIFCRCFEGSKLNPKVNMVDYDAVGCDLLLQMTSLMENYVIFPQEGE